MKGLKLRSVIGLFCLVLILAGVLVAHVWKQNAYVRMSMDAVRLGKAQAKLRNEIALIEVSVGGLKRISRIESLAKERFGLEYGKAPVLVFAEGSGRPAHRDAEPAEGGGLRAGKVGWRTSGL